MAAGAGKVAHRRGHVNDPERRSGRRAIEPLRRTSTLRRLRRRQRTSRAPAARLTNTTRRCADARNGTDRHRQQRGRLHVRRRARTRAAAARRLTPRRRSPPPTPTTTPTTSPLDSNVTITFSEAGDACRRATFTIVCTPAATTGSRSAGGPTDVHARSRRRLHARGALHGDRAAAGGDDIDADDPPDNMAGRPQLPLQHGRPRGPAHPRHPGRAATSRRYENASSPACPASSPR